MKKKFTAAAIWLTAFLVWTITVLTADRQPLGPGGSVVGLATLNGLFHNFTGVHMALYHITDLLSIIPLGIVSFFGLMGLTQWVRRKKLRHVDYDILALGGFYGAVLGLFFFFENCIVNYRPVLIEGVPEASYPSSTTMLVMCVMPTAMMQVMRRIENRLLRNTVIILFGLFTLFMVTGRLISGVHWLTDIIAGALLSAGMVTLYSAVCEMKTKEAL